MRDRWYSDNRDLVKWASLVHLAKTNGIENIIQVAFYRPDEEQLEIDCNGDTVPIPPQVLNHFRSLEDIKRLQKPADLRIDVLKDTVGGDRGAQGAGVREKYLRVVLSAMKKRQENRLILFLDPDTGLAPKRPKLEHVLAEEVEILYGHLKAGDWLALYQHKYRQRDWLENSRQRLARAVGVPLTQVNIFSCQKLAKDVAILVLEKA